MIGGDPVIMLEAPAARDHARAGEGRHEQSTTSTWFEVNEAFASVPIAWLQNYWRRSGKAQRQWRRDRARPPARRVGHQADDHAGLRAQAPWQAWGLQTMCEGGGLANVTIVERL